MEITEHWIHVPFARAAFAAMSWERFIWNQVLHSTALVLRIAVLLTLAAPAALYRMPLLHH